MAPNVAVVVGTAGSGKSSLKDDLTGGGDKIRFTTKYLDAEVRVEERQSMEDVSGGALVVVIKSLGCLEVVKEKVGPDLQAKTRLLVVNEVHEGAALEDLCYDASVIDWALTHQFEIVYRHFLSTARTEFNRNCTLKLSLLDDLPSGTPRVFQALSCTPWSPLSNTAALLYDPTDTFPSDVLSALPCSNGTTFDIATKYYTASVTFTTAPHTTPPADPHAVIAVFRTPITLANIISQGLPPAEVGVLLGIGPEAAPSRGAAWDWALDHGYEVVMLDAIEPTDEQPMAERVDEDDTFARVVEAMHATEWKVTGKPQAPEVVEKKEEPEERSEEAVEAPVVEVKEATSRWHCRWVSAVAEEAKGCELPPGWIFDVRTKKSRPLDSITERARDVADPMDLVVDGSDKDSDEDLEDYDKLLQEAMFLRHQGAGLHPDERHERAADVAMRMMGSMK